ncbi:hypothetical protein CP02DC14_1415 [Chlamydia psittaci 02DC14]|nr:hypothetical protein CP02DC14_1415 [Chlamydia psittaci 02DC14]
MFKTFLAHIKILKEKISLKYQVLKTLIELKKNTTNVAN